MVCCILQLAFPTGAVVMIMINGAVFGVCCVLFQARRGAKIRRIRETRSNPLAKCNMTEIWQVRRSALDAVGFLCRLFLMGGTFAA